MKSIVIILVIVLISFVAAISYYKFTELSFKEPAGSNTRFYERHSYTYNIFQWPLQMPYYILSPGNVKQGVKYPLLVVLHGGSRTSYAASLIAETEFREKYKTYVLVPVTPVNHIWRNPYESKSQFGNGLPYVIDVVNEIAASHPIDSNRIYVMGCSMGGSGAIISSLYYQDTFAAAVGLAGYFYPTHLPKEFNTPLLMVHGKKDRMAPVEYARKTHQILKSSGAQILYHELEHRGHECSSKSFYSEQMWNWLFSQRKES